MRKRTSIVTKYGVIPITLYTANVQCDISCIYCPTVKDLPKSYTYNQDTIRAKQMHYSASKQIEYWKNRIIHELGGVDPFKLEVIILGGTFSLLSKEYIKNYLKEMYDQLNESYSPTLTASMQRNKSSRFRACIVTIETRPDLITNEECLFFKSLGITKIELGVQTIDDKILHYVGRPYSQKEVKYATRLLKTNGFKVGYHLMINLPKSSIKIDNEALYQITHDIEYYPDFVKIYPTTLLKNRKAQKKLWALYQTQKWIPYNKEEIVKLLYTFKMNLPENIRLQRIQRQFTGSDYLYGGYQFRNKIKRFMTEHNEECNCIRCRELKTYNHKIKINNHLESDISFEKLSESEIFFSASYQNYLLGYMRLHISNKAIIRELKIIGKASSVGKSENIQGKGIGKKLINNAKLYAIEIGFNKLHANVAPGAKRYFERMGFCENTSLMELQL